MTRKISNPFRNKAAGEYQCFGCSPHNPIGLQLNFYELDQRVCCDWLPSKPYEGYGNVLHGGIQATLLDEIASWTVYTQCGTAGVTQSMDITYLKPVIINGIKIRIKAQIEDQNDRNVFIKATLENGDGIICSTANITYFIFPEAIARRKYHYPGKEHFYSPEIQ